LDGVPIGHPGYQTSNKKCRCSLMSSWAALLSQPGRIKMNKHLKYLLVVASLILFSSGLITKMQAQEEEPIAYIGHGAFFDQNGKQIEVTLAFVAKAQDWYRTKLLSSLTDSQKNEFGRIEEELNTGIEAVGQDRLVVQQHLLDWLVANSESIRQDGRTIGKLKALKYALHFKLPARAGIGNFKHGEEFKVNPEIDKKLRSPEFTPREIQLNSATINTGQAYIDECVSAGVPIPPPIGELDPAGLTGWRSMGFIPSDQVFIEGTPAEVRVFQSSSPEGMCIALPRYTDETLSTVYLDGVICLGKASSKVCFWDNQKNDMGFSFPSGDKIPIGVPDLSVDPNGRFQAGGFELEGGSGGVCTDCHAGQNPYIIHPKLDLGGGLLMEELNIPPLNLPTFSASRYDPLVAASWPQNQLSHSPALVPAACVGCHNAGGTAGAFPHLSSELGQYCGILAQAIARTMPPGNPGGLVNDPTVRAFQDWCNVPASAGPSDRGDPHITTTNGINYDFQAAGEFTALRNSATNFELQVRQTPVSTASVVGPDPHTGLTGCVSINTAVAVRLGPYRVSYQPRIYSAGGESVLQLYINGRPVLISPQGIDLGGGRIVPVAIGNGIEIFFPDQTRLLVISDWWPSQNKWYMNIDLFNATGREGLMGAITSGNWLPRLPDGSSLGPMPAFLPQRFIDLNQKFADAWRLTDITSLFTYAPGTSTATYTNLNWPPQTPPCIIPGSPIPPAQPLDPEYAQRLCREIRDEKMRAQCVFDVTVTGQPGFAQTYLRTQQLR
jgi:hypothetical protein